jgi:peptidoglycan hydrolase CwlO-like protein
MDSLILTAIILLAFALILSRLFPVSEGFQATQADLCETIKKNKSDIQTQLDTANASVTDAQVQITKIQNALNDLTGMASSFSCS